MIMKPNQKQSRKRIQITKYCRTCGKWVHWRTVHYDHQDGYLTPEYHCEFCDEMIDQGEDIPRFEEIPKLQREN